jgi:ATP-dependent helicase HrpA
VRDVEARLDGLTAAPLQAAVADVRSQLDRLVAPGFIAAAGVGRLRDVLRYVRAAERRLDKLPSDPARDRRLMQQVHELEDDPASWRVRWPLEELRVSLFAQALGTSGPVSVQRIRKELAR